MSDQRPNHGDTRCPVCGENGVKACVDEDGVLMNLDHAGRPPFFPPGFDRIFGST